MSRSSPVVPGQEEGLGECRTGPGLVWCSISPQSAHWEVEEAPCFLLGVIPGFSLCSCQDCSRRWGRGVWVGWDSVWPPHLSACFTVNPSGLVNAWCEEFLEAKLLKLIFRVHYKNNTVHTIPYSICVYRKYLEMLCVLNILC